MENSIDCDGDTEQHFQWAPTTREEKMSSLKTALVHVVRKMVKNAHANFILGLMHQRLCQPDKAILAYEKAEEILLGSEEYRPELLSLVQVHHAQCLLFGSIGDYGDDKELGAEEVEEILSKLKESMQLDVRQIVLWNTLGLLLLKTGRPKSAISILSSAASFAPKNLDVIGNLGIAYLQNGSVELSGKCFQFLALNGQNHPAATINYAAFILCKYGSVEAGAGARSSGEDSSNRAVAANVAKECLLSALKIEPQAAHIWGNLANAYHLSGDYTKSANCLEKAALLEPNCMSVRYAVALNRVKDAETHQNPNGQLCCAANEMASVIREADSNSLDLPIAWAGFSMVHKINHEITATFQTDHQHLSELEAHAIKSLKQAVAENADDHVQWHRLGVHSLCTRQFKTARRYLKAALLRLKGKDASPFAWLNLGVSLQLSDELAESVRVYKRALSVGTSREVHAVFSNLGVLYRQRGEYGRAKAVLGRALDVCPGYPPALNNLGLVYVAEGDGSEAASCFRKALQVDPFMDAATSNLFKVFAISRGGPS